MADAVFGFNDHFPSSLPPEPPPSGGGGFPGFGGGGGGGRSAGVRPAPPRPMPGGGAAGRVAADAAKFERVAMAHSFSRLAGFRRIGGVLIGRPPSGEPHLDFTGFEWQHDGVQVKLTLKRYDGRTIVLGPFRPEIVHLAMVYAADGRPVTATMVTAAPLRELKILLHPALEDTAMGCRAIEIDRLVDRFAGSSGTETPSPRQVDSLRVISFLELYHWAWAVTVTAAHEQASSTEASPVAQDLLGALNAPAQRDLDRVGADASSRSGSLLLRALEERHLLLHPDYSPLSVKTDYFAPEQVRRLANCVANTLEATRACLVKDVPTLLRQTARNERMDWTAPPPTIEIWSGVREVPFHADADLAFANPAMPPQRGTPFAPLSFILQVAFTSEPLLAKHDKPWFRLREGELDDVSDETPWQFPHLQPWIDQQVRAGIAGASDALDVFGATREFTALQRLFRLALAEGLGPRFPLAQLEALADSSRKWVRIGVRTPRWNPRPGLIEADALGAAHLLREMEDQPEKLRAAGGSCVDAFAPLLNNGRDQVQLAAITPAKWRESCPIPPADDEGPVGQQAKQAVELFTRLSAARELRQMLGVLEEDKAMLEPEHRGCLPF